MEQITLEMACEADAPAMLAIYAPYVEDTTVSWEYQVPTLEEFTARLREHLADGFPWLTARTGEQILGYAYAGRFGARRGFDWDAEATVYLAPEARGKGLGSMLYGALLALLAKQGYVNCYALVTHPNIPSAAFHRAMGFTEAARLPQAGYKDGQWLGLSYFHRPLCPAVEVPVPPCPVWALPDEVRARILAGAAASRQTKAAAHA